MEYHDRAHPERKEHLKEEVNLALLYFEDSKTFWRVKTMMSKEYFIFFIHIGNSSLSKIAKCVQSCYQQFFNIRKKSINIVNLLIKWRIK